MTAPCADRGEAAREAGHLPGILSSELRWGEKRSGRKEPPSAQSCAAPAAVRPQPARERREVGESSLGKGLQAPGTGTSMAGLAGHPSTDGAVHSWLLGHTHPPPPHIWVPNNLHLASRHPGAAGELTSGFQGHYSWLPDTLALPRLPTSGSQASQLPVALSSGEDALAALQGSDCSRRWLRVCREGEV